MTKTKPVLTPPDLVKHPQLATVELLRNALELMRTALFAAHPELFADEDYIATDPDSLDAEHIMSVIGVLLPVLKSYREHVQAEHDPLDRHGSPDIPF